MKARSPRTAVALVMLLAWRAAGADESGDTHAQRQAIERARAGVEAEYRAGERACQERFAVNDCLEPLRARKRAALAVLRDREIELDEAKRRAEAEAARQRREDKRTEAQHKAAPASAAVADAAASAPGPGASANTHGALPAARDHADRLDRAAKEAAAAEQRVAAQQRRASEAQAHRERVERRNAERAAKGKVAAPLPLPDAASAPPR